MTIDIPSAYKDILLQAVANGAFANPEDALKHALELFAAEQSNTDDKQRLNRWNERNAAAIQQSKQGLSAPLDPQAVGLRTEGLSD